MLPLTKPYTLFPSPRTLHAPVARYARIAPRLRRFATIGRCAANDAAARADGRFAAFNHVAALSFEAYLFDTSCATFGSQNLAVFCPKRGVVAGRLHLREGHMARPAAK